MARNDKKGRTYDSMSNEELITIIGTDVDPTASRSELITRAMEADRARNK